MNTPLRFVAASLVGLVVASVSVPSLATKDAEPKPDAPMTANETAMWALVGVASVALVTGGIFGLNALDEEQRYEDNPSDEFKSRGEARALVADISFGVAAAAGLTALIVGLTDPARRKKASAEKEPLSISAGFFAGRAELTVEF